MYISDFSRVYLVSSQPFLNSLESQEKQQKVIVNSLKEGMKRRAESMENRSGISHDTISEKQEPGRGMVGLGTIPTQNLGGKQHGPPSHTGRKKDSPLRDAKIKTSFEEQDPFSHQAVP